MSKRKLIKLTRETLHALQKAGFQYVIVQGFTGDGRIDLIEMTHFRLLPFKKLPGQQGEQGVFTEINSEVLRKWADSPNQGSDVYIDLPESAIADITMADMRQRVER